MIIESPNAGNPPKDIILFCCSYFKPMFTLQIWEPASITLEWWKLVPNQLLDPSSLQPQQLQGMVFKNKGALKWA